MAKQDVEMIDSKELLNKLEEQIKHGLISAQEAERMLKKAIRKPLPKKPSIETDKIVPDRDGIVDKSFNKLLDDFLAANKSGAKQSEIDRLYAVMVRSVRLQYQANNWQSKDATREAEKFVKEAVARKTNGKIDVDKEKK